MKLNLPNKLTIARMVMVPFLMIFIAFDFGLGIWSRLIAAVFFGAASFTDFVDGHIARRDGLVTNFGKFLDPLADKMLVATALLAIVDLGNKGLLSIGTLPAWIVVFIILREFMVSGIRLVAATQNTVLAANYWGKLKTVVQMLTIIVYLLPIENE